MTDPREFWKIAGTFPPDKEAVYPDHVIAQEFAQNVGKTVLEYGCGGGSDTLSYLRRGCSVYFADIVRDNVVMTHRRVAEGGYLGKAKAVMLTRSDGLDAIPSGTVDVVSAHGVLHHVEDQETLERILLQFHRVLRPSGKLYVMLYTEMLWEKYKGARDKLLAKNPALNIFQAFGQLTDGEGCPFATFYSEEDGRRLLSEHGFVWSSSCVYNNDDFRTFRVVRS